MIKCIRNVWIPARPPCSGYGSPAPVKVVRKTNEALRAGFLYAAPPLTVLGEPRRGWLGFRAGASGRKYSVGFDRRRLVGHSQHARAVLALIAAAHPAYSPHLMSFNLS